MQQKACCSLPFLSDPISNGSQRSSFLAPQHPHNSSQYPSFQQQQAFLGNRPADHVKTFTMPPSPANWIPQSHPYLCNRTPAAACLPPLPTSVDPTDLYLLASLSQLVALSQPQLQQVLCANSYRQHLPGKQVGCLSIFPSLSVPLDPECHHPHSYP